MLSQAILTGLLLLADARIPSGRAENARVELSASVYIDKTSIRRLLGSDLGGYFIVVEVTLTPKASGPVDVRRDDFLLRTDKDGDRSQPFVGSQIAGQGALVISQTGGGGGIMSQEAGPIWGGAPGTMDRPRRMGGDGGGFGNAGSGSETQATTTTGETDKENPLKAVLDQKILTEAKISKPVSGLLYFPLEAKQKIKDLELIYTTPAGKLSLRFR